MTPRIRLVCDGAALLMQTMEGKGGRWNVWSGVVEKSRRRSGLPQLTTDRATMRWGEAGKGKKGGHCEWTRDGGLLKSLFGLAWAERQCQPALSRHNTSACFWSWVQARRPIAILNRELITCSDGSSAPEDEHLTLYVHNAFLWINAIFACALRCRHCCLEEVCSVEASVLKLPFYGLQA